MKMYSIDFSSSIPALSVLFLSLFLSINILSSFHNFSPSNSYFKHYNIVVEAGTLAYSIDSRITIYFF